MLDASVSRMNGRLKSGNCKTGYALIFLISVVTASFSLVESSKGSVVVSLVKFVSGAAISA